MKASAKGWAVAEQQVDLSHKMLGGKDRFDFEERKRKLADAYINDADSKKEKKSVVAQIMFFADRELWHE